MTNHFISSELLVHLGGLFFVLFALIGAFDGIYFHLIKYKLHLNPQSRLEHKIHTLRAFLFVPIVYFIFSRNSVGAYLFIGIFFTVVDLGIEVLDILVEKESRVNLGGISGAEYVVHVAATSCRVAAILFILVSKEPSAWTFRLAVAPTENYPIALVLFANAFLVGTLLGGTLQLVDLVSDRVPRLYRAHDHVSVLPRSQFGRKEFQHQNEVFRRLEGDYHLL